MLNFYLLTRNTKCVVSKYCHTIGYRRCLHHNVFSKVIAREQDERLQMGNIIGIDLGTTNSCVAFFEGTQPKVIENAEGTRVTPSQVAITLKGERLVGNTAKNQATINSLNTFYATKRLIGRRFDDPVIQELKKHLPYQLVKSNNGDAWVADSLGKTYAPAEIGALVLMKMKETAEAHIKTNITNAIITVPAYFNDAQRQATKDAGRIAGLNVVRIINEPTAAALAYGVEKNKDQTIAVYDLGGGTFDITILQIQRGVFEVKATNGNTMLGGEDFDNVILMYLMQKFKEQHGFEIGEDPQAMQRLRQAAEMAKRELSTAQSTFIDLPFLANVESGPKHLHLELCRGKLNNLVAHLIQSTIEPCQTALADAEIKAADVQQVLLVGGMTRMPAVQAQVQAIFGSPPSRAINPDEAVAVGAAVQGAILTGQLKDVLLLDVTPLTLGVEIDDGIFSPLIRRNTTIPVVNKKIFSTCNDNQTEVEIKIYQGEREMARDNKLLGSFVLLDIPKGARGAAQIEVTFDIDANGIVSVSAVEQTTGKQQKLVVKANGGLSEKEIEEMIKAAQRMKLVDERKRTVTATINKVKRTFNYVQKLFEEYEHVISSRDTARIKRDMERLQQYLDDNEDLNVRATESVADEMYNYAFKVYKMAYAKSNTAKKVETIEEMHRKP